MKSLFLKIMFLLNVPFCMAGENGKPCVDGTSEGFNDSLHKRISNVYLTDKITTNDDRNIKSKAESVVKRFMNLLNTIATGLDLEVPETEGIIRKSYLPVESKIFYDSAVVVVDDLRKVESISQAKEKAAHSYLRDFEIFYKKSEKASVFFSNFEISNVKKGNYLYIKVTYDCLFGNKSKISDEPFGVQKRVAELRVEKLNNKWKTWIIDVHFLDSLDIVEANKNDIEVVDAQKSSADSLTADNDQENFIIASNTSMDPVQREALRRRNDSVRTYMAFRNLIDSGKHSLNNGQYILAYQFFNEAETVTNGSNGIIRQADVDFLQTMIKEARKNIAYAHRTPEEVFAGYMQDAALQKGLRNYDKALEAYSKALEIKPADENALQKKRTLSALVSALAAMEAKYAAGKYKDAIHEYEKAIKSDPNNSDYYVGRGKCYEKIRELKKAMSDYKRAIELDENHLQAYKEKGNLHEKQGDFANAIACYSICVTKDKNDVSSFLRLADLNLLAGNQNAAITALEKGIASNSSIAVLHFKKGEILQLMKQSARAIESFSTSIAFDSSNADAHFKRGLSYVDAKQVGLAAEDFTRARRFGLDSASNNITRQIAEDFFNSANRQFATGYYQTAITQLDQAILINPYKPEYRFQRGQYYLIMKQPDPAIQNFSDVLSSDPLNVRAFQLRGLAKHQKGQYQDAVADFNQAIKLNPRLPETHKYAGDALLKDGDYLNAIV
ncbi:MAG TPA: tetratricopeptide repeat protein, partial [Flavitalea sp.]|nr:tetratricopeptide repeat protein [Flavitalea sp.]